MVCGSHVSGGRNPSDIIARRNTNNKQSGPRSQIGAGYRGDLVTIGYESVTIFLDTNYSRTDQGATVRYTPEFEDEDSGIVTVSLGAPCWEVSVATAKRSGERLRTGGRVFLVLDPHHEDVTKTPQQHILERDPAQERGKAEHAPDILGVLDVAKGKLCHPRDLLP